MGSAAMPEITEETFKNANEGIKVLVQADPPQDKDLKWTTACICCNLSWWLDFPSCCSVNSLCECLLCDGQSSCQCLTCIDQKLKRATKAWETLIVYARCCDMMEEGNFTLCEEGAVAVQYCCVRGAAKFFCGFSHIKFCYSIQQEICCDFRCQLPPGPKVPFGVACCGFKLAGNPGGSCGGAAAPAEATTVA